jgi:hypothetical protein
MTRGSQTGTPVRVAWAEQRKAFEDQKSRKEARKVTGKVAATVVMAIVVWLVSHLFDDPLAIREVVAATVIGLGGAYLAVEVLREKTKERGAPLEKDAPPEPVLVLAGVDLRGAVLPGVALERSELVNAWLAGADLNAANLKASRLAGADLRHADLRRADLRLAELCGSDLRATDLRATDLRGALLDHARFEGALYNEATHWPQKDRPPPGSIRVEGARGPKQ